jgi:hypothetical protein
MAPIVRRIAVIQSKPRIARISRIKNWPPEAAEKPIRVIREIRGSSTAISGAGATKPKKIAATRVVAAISNRVVRKAALGRASS